MSTMTQRLANGDVILIDGATGTEMERNGVPMQEGAWCGVATLEHGDAIQRVHESHLAAGAEMIVANTYASSRHILAQAGFEDRFAELNQLAVDIALKARAASGRHDALVAGSISTTTQGGTMPSDEEARINYRDQARILADSGVDLIVLEMMREVAHTEIALDAALAVGLPVWVGFSCVLDAGVPVLWHEEDHLVDAIRAVRSRPIEVMTIMHTDTADVDACLDVLQQEWDGPIGVYAQSGEFRPPNWLFIDTITPEDYDIAVQRWVKRGVQVIGGCCGIGPEHIAHLRSTLPARISLSE